MFLSTISMVLNPEIYLPDEEILVVGQVSRSAYFIERGRVQVRCNYHYADSYADGYTRGYADCYIDGYTA